MKILFSIPIMSYISDTPPIIQDLGLGYLAAATRKEGHIAIIRDWNMNPSHEDYISFLNKECPDVVALKVFTKDVGAAARTIDTIKSTNSSIKIIVGGPHPSAARPEEIFEDLKGIDFAVQGEGEESLTLLLRYLSMPEGTLSDKLLSEIPGLVWIQDGSIRSNQRQLTDINHSGLPAWDMLNPKQYLPLMGLKRLDSGYSAPFITSRGCPGRCTFCSVKLISGNKVRRRPLQSIIEEMSLLYFDYNVRFLMIMDNGFLVDEDFVQEMCAAMIEKGLKFQWDCVLIDTGRVLKRKTAEMMKKAGCVMVNMGIESGSQRVRKSINKLNTMDTIRETVSLLRKYGIDVFGFFILGFPAETRMEMQESIRLARSLDFKMVSFTICFPIPGTKVYEYVLNKYNVDRIKWESFDIHNSPYPCSELTSSELSKLARMKNLEFMIRKDPLHYFRKSFGLLKKVIFSG